MKSQINSFCSIFVFQFRKMILKKYCLLFLCLLTIQIGFSQNNLLWKGYFSYNEIKDIAQSSNKVFAASENALFSKSLQTNIVKTTNTIDGLSGQTISAMHHSTAFNKTLVGYENGLMIVINEADGSMLNVVDIINKQLAPNIKKINHFMEYNGIVYISCDFGIVQYNIATLGFGDTYFIGSGVAEIIVQQTAIFNGFIYAATLNNGIKRADVLNENLVDANQWTQVNGGNWTGVETFGTELMAVTIAGQLNRFNGSVFSPYTQLSQATLDIRVSGNYLVLTTANQITIYNQTLGVAVQVNNSQIPDMSAQFTCATVIDQAVFIGTLANGVVTTTIANPSIFEYISPDGPIRNNIFALQSTTNTLWAVYGDYDVFYNPYPLDYFGVSKYTSSGWLNRSYDELEQTIGAEVASMVRITVNPNNEDLVYVSSFHSGLLKMENDLPSVLYNQNNSGLESVAGGNSIRINGSAFDKSGNLWVTNSIVNNGLKVLRTNGQWQSYNMENYYLDVGKFNLGRLSIDKNGTKWMVTRDDGVIGFNENGTIFKKINMGSENGNLPIDDVRVATVDNRNQLWVGTRKGLRVLSSVDRFQSENQLTTNPIIILEEEVAQELLYEQFITDIVVDGANNKWIGTADSGVFMVSPNGQQTIYRFTINNSPLPSNAINDIEINATTGEVFIATAKGMVSFKGIATKPSENLSNVIVYPNPVRPEFTGTVKISGLINKATIKIADIEGNLVYETVSEGGTIEWDTTAFGKYRVASGVYIIFISAQDGIETKVKKVMIIR